jgi:glycosyltransferase involved in cell wall biosynthesis
MRVGVIHNLQPGGAHRRMSEQISRFESDVVEVCLATAAPVTSDPRIVSYCPRAPRVARAVRTPLRYTDFIALLRAWRKAANLLRGLQVDVMYANPCRYLQSPAALLERVAPSLYFCDEPRRVDHDPAAKGSRNRATRHVYWPLHAAERRLDRWGVDCASRLATNSSFTAREIERAYGRDAVVIALGAGELWGSADARAPEHILSVGKLIRSKGHDLAIAAAGRAAVRWPVLIVAPAPEVGEEARLRAVAGEVGVELTIRTGISDGELAVAYAAAQATLYMAEREPFGLASLEAQAAGSPVIVSAEGGLPETIAEGRSGWAVPRSADAVSVKLDLLDAPGVRDSFAAAARAHAAAATWSRSSAAVESILRELCCPPQS